MNKFNSEEKEILEAFETGNLKRANGALKIIGEHQKYAKATSRKDARINIRLSSRDLRALQVRAMKEGIPYQTLVASVLHKFVDGQLVDKAANK